MTECAVLIDGYRISIFAFNIYTLYTLRYPFNFSRITSSLWTVAVSRHNAVHLKGYIRDNVTDNAVHVVVPLRKQ